MADSMLIPRYRASARLEGKNPKGRRRVAMRMGWSDTDEAAAKAHAETRAAEAMRRIEAGEPAIAWRECAGSYGTETVPIREEVVERFGDTAVTRNAYGALCLNAPDVFFADVDLSPAAPLLARKWLRLPLAAVGGFAAAALMGGGGTRAI